MTQIQEKQFLSIHTENGCVKKRRILLRISGKVSLFIEAAAAEGQKLLLTQSEFPDLEGGIDLRPVFLHIDAGAVNRERTDGLFDGILQNLRIRITVQLIVDNHIIEIHVFPEGSADIILIVL